MMKKRFPAIILAALLLTACQNTQTVSDNTEETAETTSATSEMTLASSPETTIDKEETEEVFETTAEQYITGNPEDGLVYFVQPSVILYPRYEMLDDWVCRDSEVLHNYHYDREWNYCKELIFAFSNYTDEPVTVDSIQIFRGDEPLRFTNGSDTLDINFTVQSLHKTDYLLQSEDFDYSACESGIYRTVVNVNDESLEQEFFINNTELFGKKYTSENTCIYDDNDSCVPYEYNVFAPTFLNEEQQQIFAQATGIMWDWFWCSHHISQSYIDEHTPDDFMQMLYDVFTEEYADKLSHSYIDENGDFIVYDGDRGGNISYFDHCFFPVSADENTVEFKAVVTYCHFDDPYDVSFDDDFHYVMKNTENGWRVERFDLWK